MRQVFSPTSTHSFEPKAMNMAQITVMRGKSRAVVAHCGKTNINTIMEEKAESTALLPYFLCGVRHAETVFFYAFKWGPRKVVRLFGERRNSKMSELFVLARKRTIWSLFRRVRHLSKQRLWQPKVNSACQGKSPETP